MSAPTKKQASQQFSSTSRKTLGPISDLERHLPSDWWRNIFNSLYLKTDGDVVENDANTSKDIDLVIKAAGFKPSDHILDLCCGQGRHSIELAKRGFSQITGIDRSRYLIRLARKRSKQNGLNVLFSEGDARSFKVPESSKDGVIVMGNSFGYFEKQEDDVKVLNAIKRALKPGGTLVIDVVNGEWMAKNFEPRSWEWIDQVHFVNRERTLSSDRKRIISREVITHSEIGVLADQFYAERLYTVAELTAILEKLGFKEVLFQGQPITESTRAQDLGMMGNRIMLTAKCPSKPSLPPRKFVQQKVNVLVLMGDPELPDPVKKDGHFNQEDFETISSLKDALASLPHYNFTYLDQHKNYIKTLQNKTPHLVFNLCDEGFMNDARKELHVPALLEVFGVPYTGAGPGALALCYNKAHVRTIATSLEIDTPMETYYDTSDHAANLPAEFPALIKPNCGDSSIGITKDALVDDAASFLGYLDYLKKTLPGAHLLIQEYLCGEEYSVGVIGNKEQLEFLPILEVDYSALPADLPPILCYESKWVPDSPYWSKIKYKQAELDEESVRKLEHFSRLLFDRLECRDYARFDFRRGKDGRIKLLEVNPNPGWCWDGKLNLMAKMKGMSYGELLDKILQSALQRNNLV